jgi:hypothetical protein
VLLEQRVLMSDLFGEAEDAGEFVEVDLKPVFGVCG